MKYEIHVEAANLRKLKAGESPRPVWRIVDHADPARTATVFDIQIWGGQVTNRQTFSTRRSGSAYLLTSPGTDVLVRATPDSEWLDIEEVI